MASALLSLDRIGKTYGGAGNPIVALAAATFDIEAGEMVAIMGPSGSGKSTLLNIVGCLDRPSSGSFRLAGTNVAELADHDVSSMRGRKIGFVFQTFNLIPTLSVLENVALPFRYRGEAEAAATDQSMTAIRRVGLAHRSRHRPAELSGGEMQRVAIARAMAGGPDVVLADEPTGNLDSTNSHGVLDLFDEINRGGTTVIVITHSEEIARRCRRLIELRDGRVVADRRGA